MISYSVDRLEGEMVVLIDQYGEQTELPLSAFSFSPQEGMIVRLVDDVFYPEHEKTKEMKEMLATRLGNLFKRR